VTPEERPEGALYVVATPIGNIGDISERARRVLAGADLVACEDTRRTGRLLDLLGIAAPRLVAVHAHNEAERIAGILDRVLRGEVVALVSDVGTPLVSDPGERLVAAVAAAGLRVVAVPGASAVLTALVASGISASRWRFEGFLPRKGAERRSRLTEIATAPHPSVLYESPHRVAATLDDLVSTCGPQRRVAVARELTKLHEQVWRGPLVGAVEMVAATEPRGEHVVVVDGAPAAEPVAASELHAALARLVAAGMDRRAAVTAAVVLLGASKRDAYEISLEVARS
jgi:16S rRNA (cytidine1402-2'-O)-methyltransferase